MEKSVKARYLSTAIQSLCFQFHKMTFVSGPRQCGKTTLARAFLAERPQGHYFNWDEKRFRIQWAKDPLGLVQTQLATTEASTPLIVLDEIHKAKHWKRDLKGVYDHLTSAVDLWITGSAKLNVYRRGSDSLLGRYHHFRLHPFSVGELLDNQYSCLPEALIQQVQHPTAPFHVDAAAITHFNALLQYGPFPEPLFAEHPNVLNLWHQERVERLIREDLRDLSRIQELSQIEMLVSLLPERASGVLSITSLREDLEVSHATMKRWVEYLKYVYYLFELKPYAKALARSLKKEGKVYLWDFSEIADKGARFENLVASHLLKYAHFLTDTGTARMELHYLKNKEHQEIDFLLTKDGKPWLPIEVKCAQDTPSEHWKYYFKKLPCKHGIQLVQTPDVSKKVAVGEGEVWVVSASQFLALLY